MRGCANGQATSHDYYLVPRNHIASLHSLILLSRSAFARRASRWACEELRC